MRVFDTLMRVGTILLGIAAVVWGLFFWHVVARDNPQLLSVVDIQARIVGFVVIGLAMIVGPLLFWGPMPRIILHQPRYQIPPTPRVDPLNPEIRPR